LPEIGTDTELEIAWYSEGPAATATLRLDARSLLLSVSDADETREVYSCDAGFDPAIDRSDFRAWLSFFQTLNAPEVAIMVWDRGEGG
jgi:hypothetical protein